jgi:hypothetical protein
MDGKKFINKSLMYSKRAGYTALMFLFVFPILNKVYAADPPPQLKDITNIVYIGVTLLWGFFVLESLFFLARYGLKFLFVWAGAIDPNTELAKEMKGKLGGFMVAFVGVFALPLMVSITINFLASAGSTSTVACYEWLSDTNWFPVFQIYFSTPCT